MAAFSVFDNEMKVMDQKIAAAKKKKESPEFFEEKKELIEGRMEVSK